MKNRDLYLLEPNVVAVASCEADLHRAAKFSLRHIDAVEIRVDKINLSCHKLRLRLREIKVPMIITVRDQREGGSISSTRERTRLFLEFLPFATLIDLELRRLQEGEFKRVVKEAREKGVGIIGSNHDFDGVPSFQRQLELLWMALRHKCAVLKIALTLEDRKQVLPLVHFMSGARVRIPISMMSMGRLGRETRPLFARARSALNYGFISEPSATGQWEARALGREIKRFKS